ncbi:unnamed protein product [Rotaria magnacalcarata]|uniref:Protein farnesyltransferase subunit beta n=5 Tax=Rotaria magnacalcarata TaxID=392030 RepID=A0A819P840_9BILA|nr:unnamed protein product [Rotaria magnacalcarata]CAF4019013.1 unnamed protein product [Rotaria magnacalcarata]
MSLRISQKGFFTNANRTRNVDTTTNREQRECEEAVEKLFQRFLHQQTSVGLKDPPLLRDKHLTYLLKGLLHLSSSSESLDASRPWLVYWITQSLYLLNETLSNDFIDDICDFLHRCQHPDGGFGGGPGQVAHLAPTYAAVNALCLLRNEKAYKVVNRKKLSAWLKTILDPTNGSFSLHVDGESDIRATYCAASVATLCQLEDLPDLFKNTAEWVASCQTYEGGFGACPGAEAHGGYSFCGYATLLLLDRESICDRDSLLRWTVNRQMSFEGGFQGRTNKLVDGCYSFWVGAILPLIQAVQRKMPVRDSQDLFEILDKNIKNHQPLFDTIAAQEYVLLCCQGEKTGGFTDRPKTEARTDFYHTCYCLSGLSLFQDDGQDQTTAVCGGDSNALRNTHPLFNIGPECAREAMDHYSKQKQ